MHSASIRYPLDFLSGALPRFGARDQGIRAAVIVSLLVHGICLGWLPGLKGHLADLPQRLQLRLPAPVVRIEPVAVAPTRDSSRSASAIRREGNPPTQDTLRVLTNPAEQTLQETPSVRAAEPVLAKTDEILRPGKPPDVLPSKRGDANLLTGYGLELAGAIATHQRYPRIALLRQWQGSVLLQLEFGGDGRLLTVRVLSSSGHEVLDRQALEMVREASPLPQLPAALTGQFLTVDVPVVFRITS